MRRSTTKLLILVACLLVAVSARAQSTWSDLTSQAGQAQKRKEWAEAERLYVRAIDAGEEEGFASPNHLQALQNLGVFYVSQKRFADAEKPLRQVVTAMERVFGPDDERLLDPLGWLFPALFFQKKYADAEAVIRRSLAIFEKHLGGKHGTDPHFLLERLALVLRAQGRTEEAEAVLRGAGEMPTEEPHAQNVIRARELIRIANVHLSRKDREKAEAPINQAFELLEGADPTDPWLHDCLREIARYYYNTGRVANAEPIYLRLLTAQEGSSGRARLNRTSTMQALGDVYLRLNRLDEAEQMLRRARETGPELGEETFRRILPGIMVRLAEVAAARGHYAEAEEMLRKEAEREEAEPKGDSPSWPGYPFAWLGLARLYASLDRYAEAEAFFRKIIAEQERNLGPEEPELEQTLFSYANLLRKMGRTAEARAVETRIKRMHEKHRN